ncbi:conserved hypothetical protein [Bosea sp. 62]|uniref:TadE/TadG family type IV pilus assembly protein n=1 Tax=unclassified Bosea (in: a-proteobacteria) TaxID=2653178 RepID=UPI0012555910|nr:MULTISPECIES: TadE/TadG family type IV pilus assembly protein [unclassified Bosea (in: a-proteobacteria)]CAD5267564.1 conserved hypothetical protein [Bosea sp. 46]CAD5269121.1 conserved hypothetical protein [Bosea sp. 7B]CAD5269502.1 conserved hypothetical protein [Bosea sp. 21B]VVT62528.1 conserved hypothetical protein [Bosea sp. EC-HK365B]VXB96353.1 conserved hypothetical protein [Bosea sp. 29B]
MRVSRFELRWRRFQRDTVGVAAVEFAMVLPLMLLACFGMIDVVQALMAKRKVTQLTLTIADLTARAASVTPNDVNGIFDAAQSIMAPLNATLAGMVVSSVVIDAKGVAKVCWSSQRNATALASGAPVTLPDSVRVPGTSVIMARATYRYTPTLGYVLTGSLTLGNNPIYTRPRAGQAAGTANIEQIVRTDTAACPS